MSHSGKYNLKIQLYLSEDFMIKLEIKQGKVILLDRFRDHGAAAH